MSQKSELKRQVERVYNAENKLSIALQELSLIASEIYGEELQADLCDGAEIEFRRKNINGYFDSMDCVTLEDIKNKL